MMFQRIRIVIAVLVALLVIGCTTTTTVSGKGAIPQKTPDEQVDLLLVAATQYLSANDPQRSKMFIGRALEVNPKSSEAHNLLAMAFWQTMELDLAEKHFKDAIRYDSNFSKAYLNYASLLYTQNRPKEAEEYIDEALNDPLYDQRARAFMIQGMIRQQLGKHEQAIESFRRSLALDRTNPAAMFGVAVSSYEVGNYIQAERYYRQARENSQASPDSLLLGIRIADKLNDADAKSSYELALKNLFPNAPETKLYFEKEQ